MREKVLAATVAGGLLVGAGLATAAFSTPGVAEAQEDSAEAENVRDHPGHGALFEEVLADLISDGTIDKSQADAITQALIAKAEAFRADRSELRELIQGFLEDDVISVDELSQLPDDHPFNDPDGPYADAVADGELTRDEIAEVRPHPKRDWFKRGVRLGALLDDGGIDQDEFDSLPDDHPLKQIDVSEYLDDGVITIAELREIRQSQTNSGESA